MNWSDPAVQAALLQAVGAVLAAMIAGVCAALIGRQFVNQERLREQLRAAQEDVAFLLAVEEEHGKLHVDRGLSNHKQTVRKAVRERGLTWSALFTPARVATRHPKRP